MLSHCEIRDFGRVSYTKQDEVLIGPRDLKILKIAKPGLNPLINPIISRYEKLLVLQIFSRAFLT